MRKGIINGLMMLITLSITISCSTESKNPLSKVQGVFEIDKESFKSMILKERNSIDADDQKLMESILIECSIKGDSISGIASVNENVVLIYSKIIERNDSLIIVTPFFGVSHITPTSTGFSYNVKGESTGLKFNKTERTDLSPNIKKPFEERKLFEQNLGKWQKDNYVDSFGDKIESEFAYCVVEVNETMPYVDYNIYVKVLVKNNTLNFEVYNGSRGNLGSKEKLTNWLYDDEKYRQVEYKLPDGATHMDMFSFDDYTAYGITGLLYDQILENDGIIKIRFEGSGSSTDYQFEIQRNNLPEVLAGLK